MTATQGSKAPERRPVVRSQVEPRLVERRRRVLDERRRRRQRRGVAALVLVGLVLAAVGALWSPLADVDVVRISGLERLSDDTILQSSGIRTGDHMATIDLVSARRHVRDLPLVAGVRVVREWPSTVHIDVVEEVPVVMLRSGAVQRVVARSGTVLPDGLEGLDDLPLLDAPGVELVEGKALGDDLRAVIGVFSQVPDDLRSTLADASVDGSAGLTFHLADGATVRFGKAEDVPAKLAAIHAFMTQVVGECLDVVDVRQPDLVTASRRPGCVVPAPTEVVRATSSGADANDDAGSEAGEER